MTTKKLVIVIASIIGGLVLLIALFAGAIVGIIFYSISNSEASATAREFLRSNEKLKKDIGEVKDFGTFVTGNINSNNYGGAATLNLKVIGAQRTTEATVSLVHMGQNPWRVTGATYETEGGQLVDLVERPAPASKP